MKEAGLKVSVLVQYQATDTAPETVDSGAIIITGESTKTYNMRPVVMAFSQSLGDFTVASAGSHLGPVIAGHDAGVQTPSEQKLCRILNVDIGGGIPSYVLSDIGKVSDSARLNIGR